MRIDVTGNRIALLDLCRRAEVLKHPLTYEIDSRPGRVTIRTKSADAIAFVRGWHARNENLVLAYTEK